MKPKSICKPRLILMAIYACMSMNCFTQSFNDGSKQRPFTVQEAIIHQDKPGSFWVMGYISGCVKTSGALITNPASFVQTNLALGSDPAGTSFVSVQLPAGEAREVLNLADHPENLGEPVMVYGSLSKYCGIAGVKNVKNKGHFRLPNAPRSNDATLKSLKIGDETVKLRDYSYNYEAKAVSYKTEEVTVTAVPNDPGAQIVRGENSYMLAAGDNTITVIVQAENGFQQYYKIFISRLCSLPVIIKQPGDKPACEGNSHTFEVKASGDGLSYRWFLGKDSIPGASERIYTLEEAHFEKDNGFYSVEITGACGTVVSESVRLWVADTLPQTLTLNVPEIVYLGERYKFNVGFIYGYNDVTNYKWSFSNDNISFTNDEGPKQHTTYAVFGPNTQSGTVRITLTHPCGTRTVSQQVKVLDYPAGIESKEMKPDVPVFPNPFTGSFTISPMGYGSAIYKVVISDIHGNIVFYRNIDRFPVEGLQVEASRSWKPGVYLVEITTDKGLIVKKVIKGVGD